jgi:hypothetical protein
MSARCVLYQAGPQQVSDFLGIGFRILPGLFVAEHGGCVVGTCPAENGAGPSDNGGLGPDPLMNGCDPKMRSCCISLRMLLC